MITLYDFMRISGFTKPTIDWTNPKVKLAMDLYLLLKDDELWNEPLWEIRYTY